MKLPEIQHQGGAPWGMGIMGRHDTSAEQQYVKAAGKAIGSGMRQAGRRLGEAMNRAGAIHADAIKWASQHKESERLKHETKLHNFRLNAREQERRIESQAKIARINTWTSAITSLATTAIDVATKHYHAQQKAEAASAASSYQLELAETSTKLTSSPRVDLSEYPDFEVPQDVRDKIQTVVDPETGAERQLIATDLVSEALLGHVDAQARERLNGEVTSTFAAEELAASQNEVLARAKVAQVKYNASLMNARNEVKFEQARLENLQAGDLEGALDSVDQMEALGYIGPVDAQKLRKDTTTEHKTRGFYDQIVGLELMPNGEVPAEQIEQLRQSVLDSNVPEYDRLLAKIDQRENWLEADREKLEGDLVDDNIARAMRVGERAYADTGSYQKSVKAARAHADKLGVPIGDQHTIDSRLRASISVIKQENQDARNHVRNDWNRALVEMFHSEGGITEEKLKQLGPPPPGTDKKTEKIYQDVIAGVWMGKPNRVMFAAEIRRGLSSGTLNSRIEFAKTLDFDDPNLAMMLTDAEAKELYALRQDVIDSPYDYDSYKKIEKQVKDTANLDLRIELHSGYSAKKLENEPLETQAQFENLRFMALDDLKDLQAKQASPLTPEQIDEVIKGWFHQGYDFYRGGGKFDTNEALWSKPIRDAWPRIIQGLRDQGVYDPTPGQIRQYYNTEIMGFTSQPVTPGVKSIYETEDADILSGTFM
jgi:hypothetical protein